MWQVVVLGTFKKNFHMDGSGTYYQYNDIRSKADYCLVCDDINLVSVQGRYISGITSSHT
jgi:hypothetical protein